ncbi:conjugal transfer protein TraF [Marinobacteraceae bacterium S3BR75-40.1]
MFMRKVALATTIATLAGAAHAGPDSFRDARSFAMGGTGVAAARASSASFFNPALLSVKQNDEHDDFGLTLPSVNARVADDEEVVDTIDDVQDQIDRFETAIDNYNPITESGKQEVVDSGTELLDSLRAIDGDAMRADVGLGLGLTLPSQRLAVGFFADSTLRAGVQGTLDQQDEDLLQEVIDNVDNGTPAERAATAVKANNHSFQSKGRVIAAAQVEAGLTFATELDVQGNRLAIGISPKYVELRTFDFSETVDTFDENDFDSDEYETSDTFVNADIGAAYQFGQADQWTAGLSVRNLVPMDLKTVNGDKVEVNPLVRAGIAHSSEWHTLTVDLDLTKTEAFGFLDETQWLAVGGEFDIYDTLQLRAGVRHNLAGSDDAATGIEEDTQLTAGLGFSPFGARVEVSGLVGGDGEVGAAAELGVNF